MATRTETVQIGVDIGGTFTDLLLFDDSGGSFAIAKVLTTPEDPARAVRTGIEQLLANASVSADRVTRIVHGTTLVTNALIERKGARTALITTRGFRDAVEIAREHRYDLYDLFIERPEPLVPRPLRFEVDERILADGAVLTPLDTDEVTQLAHRIDALDVTAVAVSLLHSYRNPAHERQIEAILAEICPHLLVSTSSDVMPEIREYERTSTTIANVYVRPIVDRYLVEFERTVQDLGISAPIFVMLSSGGICSVDTARRYPVRLLESGPAAGALAAAQYGQATSRSRLYAFDMGGTTAKACMIDDGQPALASEFEVSRVYRFKKGSGLPIQTPVIDMIEIGAGGGSIARVDSLGLPRVGPDSAGAWPGPACYGRGGELPTVTDADLMLGYLDPNFFLGGTMALDRAAAESAIGQLSNKLGLSLLETAWGIHQVVNEQMAGAARVHAIEQGKDPRAFPLFAFGGAGPVHAYRVAEILNAAEVIVPLGAGVTSAVGFLLAPLSFDLVRTHFGPLDQLDWHAISNELAQMEDDGRSLLVQAGVPGEWMTVTRLVELRYTGQGHQVPVPIPLGSLNSTAIPALTAGFEREYLSLYGRIAAGNQIEATNWRVNVSGPRPDLPLEQLVGSRSVGARLATKGHRPIYLPETGQYETVPVFDREQLAPGDCLDGPAVIEERESTAIVGPRGRVDVDQLGNLVIAISG